MDDIETVETASPERLETPKKKNERPYSLMLRKFIADVLCHLFLVPNTGFNTGYCINCITGNKSRKSDYKQTKSLELEVSACFYYKIRVICGNTFTNGRLTIKISF